MTPTTRRYPPPPPRGRPKIPVWLAFVVPLLLAGGIGFIVLMTHEQKRDETQVVIDPDVKDLKFGQWKATRGQDVLHNEGVWMTTTVTVTGQDTAHSWEYQVALYDQSGVKINDGLLNFPTLKPGETGKASVRTDRAAKMVISRRR